MEHHNSSANIFDGTKLSDRKNYLDFLGLLSHEHFHLWNVKRIRPEALGPFDYSKENYTRDLWLAEGVTSYYDDNMLWRSELITQAEYLKLLAQNLTSYESQYAKHVQSLSDSSFDAWIKYYKPNENTSNAVVSYYIKGSLVAWLLDMSLILNSDGKYTLDHVMLDFYQQWKTSPQKGLSRHEIFDTVKKYLGDSTGDFFQNFIDGTASIDWKAWFDNFGLELTSENPSSYYLGMTTQDSAGKCLIQSIVKNSPASFSKLQAGDEILALNGWRISNSAQIDDFTKTQKLDVVFARHGRLYNESLTLVKNPTQRFSLAPLTNMTEAQSRFNSILFRRSHHTS